MSKSAEKKNERQYVRMRATKLVNAVESQHSSYNDMERASKASGLRNIQGQLSTLNIAVYTLKQNEGAEEDELDALIEKDDEYDDIIERSLHLLQSMGATSYSTNHTNSIGILPPVANVVGSKIPLPKLELPTFSNKKDESLKKFFDTFEAILSKAGSSDRELFLYLRN